jgi:hypothetical protein
MDPPEVFKYFHKINPRNVLGMLSDGQENTSAAKSPQDAAASLDADESGCAVWR